MGYGRVVYFWAMMVALLLFFLGGVFSVMEGVKHFNHPVPLSNATTALIVLGISVVLETFSLHGAMTEIRKISGGKPFIKWFRETRQSELMVIAGEDIAALAGLGIAFIAVLMTVAIIITLEVKAMITGESAAPEVHAAIKSHIEGRPEVERVIHLITLQWGEQLMIAVQAKMQHQSSDVALVDAINTVEQSIQECWPQAKWCFFEPELTTGKD